MKLPYDLIATRIGYTFKDKSLLDRAFSHSSAHPSTPLASNERLEFLGDGVIKYVLADYLYRSYPTALPKQLTVYRKRLESKGPLSEVIRSKGLEIYLKTAPKQPCSTGMCEDLFEALIGAVYLDSGMDEAYRVVIALLSDMFDEMFNDTDYRTQLKEWLEQNGKQEHHFEVLREWGPDNEKYFEMGLYVDGQLRSRATDTKKNKAEQQCAYLYLRELKIIK